MNNVVQFRKPLSINSIFSEAKSRESVRHNLAAVVGALIDSPSDEALREAVVRLQLAQIELACMKVMRLLK